MSFIVLSNSTSVILPLRSKVEYPSLKPVLGGILVSQAKTSGLCMTALINDAQEGIPRPFHGDRWCYEWRPDGENLLACWIGFPDAFFAASLDPHLRVAIELLGHFGQEKIENRSLSRIEITVKPTGEVVRQAENAAWMPEDTPKPYPMD